MPTNPVPESWPTEEAATKAVNAAAREVYERLRQARMGDAPTWDVLDAPTKLPFREAVLPTVWAALTALPDPRYAAWEEGYAGGISDAAFECEGYGTPPTPYPHENPYPSGL